MTAAEVDADSVSLSISEEDEKIRVYGSTSSEVPFKSKRKRDKNVEESQSHTDSQYDDDAQTQSLISGSESSSYKNSKRSRSSLTMGRSEGEISVRSSRSWPYSWWQHPKVRENCRVVIGAFILTVIGLILVITGIVITVSPNNGLHSLIFYIGGALFLIPGLYHVIFIYLAASGRNGFTFQNISVFT